MVLITATGTASLAIIGTRSSLLSPPIPSPKTLLSPDYSQLPLQISPSSKLCPLPTTSSMVRSQVATSESFGLGGSWASRQEIFHLYQILLSGPIPNTLFGLKNVVLICPIISFLVGLGFVWIVWVNVKSWGFLVTFWLILFRLRLQIAWQKGRITHKESYAFF